MEQLSKNPDKTASATGALTALSLSMLLASLGTSIANVALPTLAQTFDAAFQDVQWVVLAYLLAITTLIVSIGRLGDLIGRQRLLLVGIAIFTLASTLCGIAPSLWLLLIARAGQGVGAAIMLALTMAFVGETVPTARIGSAMGLLGTMSAVGTALGPSLGGVLIATIGWRFIFLINLPLGAVALLLAWRYLPAGRGVLKADRQRFDGLGTVVLGVSLAAYALAMTLGRGTFGALNLVLLLAFVAGGCLFGLVEAKAKSPLLPLDLFRDARLSAGLAVSLLVSTVMMATLVVGPFYLSRAVGLAAAMVGLVMSIGPIISAFTGLPAGRLVDYLGPASTVIVGLVVMLIGAAALATLPIIMGMLGYVIAVAILTPGYQLFQAANNTAVMKGVPSDQRGVISGMLNLSRNLGLVTGASVMGAVFAAASSTTDITTAPPAAIATGQQLTFALAAALIAAAIALALGGGALARRRPT
ncbi:MFS transporter [Devosia sp.]|uniref:MFS transporter n=1 Tax=Devosia sp. TaxID=1871048 RepID=UPI003265D406